MTAYTPFDFWTINEIFCWACYAPEEPINSFVDFGGNIGVSALYFLTLSPSVRGYVFEPLGANFDKALENTKPYASRLHLCKEAIYTYTGNVEFGMEPTGRYSGITLRAPDRLQVQCREVNNALELALDEFNQIDVLKIDIEGAESLILPSIRLEILERIRLIVVEGEVQLYENLRRAGFKERSVIKGVYRYSRSPAQAK